MKPSKVYRNGTEACVYYNVLGPINIECGSVSRAADVVHVIKQTNPPYKQCLQLQKKYKHPQ